MTVHDAMIVAGGLGTRLRPLTLSTPKPLLPLAGQPFLLGQVARLAAAGVTRVFLVVGADTAPFERLAAPAAELGVALEVVAEPEPLDTAGGVRAAIDDVDGAVFVCNGDVLTDLDLQALAQAHEHAGADATIALIRVEDTSTFGVCVREGTRIVRFVEKPAPGSLPGQDTVNAGTYVLEPTALRRFPHGPLSFERDVFPGILAAGGHVEGFVWDGVWADLGTPERYRRGHRLVLAGAMDWPSVAALDASDDGVRVHPGARVHPEATLVGPVLLLDGASVARGAVVGPMTTVGADAAVGAGARVIDSILFDHAVLAEDVVAEGLVAGHGATVERDVRLGRGVVLADGVVVPAGATVAGGDRIAS